MSVFYKLYSNKAHPPADPNVSFEGQEVLVTGSNTGLGYEAALKFAQRGAARVVLGVRSLDKGARAKEAIEAQLGGAAKAPACRIDVWELDMNSYASVRAFAARADAELARLDVAVLNAGVMSMKHARSPYGWEQDMQVNTLSTVWLALLLLPKLRASAAAATGVKPTLEFVSSGLHESVKLSAEEKAKAGAAGAGGLMEYFSEEKNFQYIRQYGMSKLFLMCALTALLDLAGDDVYAVAVCPGMTKSDLARDAGEGVMASIFGAMLSMVQRSTEEGTRTLISGVHQHLGDKGHGRFWQNDEIKPVTPLLSGDDGKQFQENIWREILEALKKDVPDILEKAKR